MSRIVWDDSGSRYYESGIDHGVLYTQTQNGEYENGVSWNGLISVDENLEGAEPTDLWADNIKYSTLISAEIFGGTIEAYTYPDEFALCDGSYTPSNGVHIKHQTRRPFGFCYRTRNSNDLGIDAYKLHIVYNAIASPSESNYETINGSPDAITFSWEVNSTPIRITGYRPTSLIIIDSSRADQQKLQMLENILYGEASTEPRLPTPGSIIGIFTGDDPDIPDDGVEVSGTVLIIPDTQGDYSVQNRTLIMPNNSEYWSIVNDTLTHTS